MGWGLNRHFSKDKHSQQVQEKVPKNTHQGNANQNAQVVTSQLWEGQTRDAATAGESVEERDPCALCVEMGPGAATTGNSVVAPQSSKTRTTI